MTTSAPVSISPEVRDWAARHGLGPDDPITDVHWRDAPQAYVALMARWFPVAEAELARRRQEGGEG